MFNLFKKKIEDESESEQAADLNKFPGEYSTKCLDGDNCDEIKNATGDFGHTETNPIPVNGPVGEIKYINRLRTKENTGLIFHRIGSIETSSVKNVDVFEMVSIDGKVWDILYFDMYHPRRSKKIPVPYHFSTFRKLYDSLPVGYGSTHRDVTFPFAIGTLIERHYDIFGTGIFSKRLAEKYNEIIADRAKFIRPKEHEDKLRKVVAQLANSSYYGLDVTFP